MIENTSENMKDPANALLMLAASMGPGGSDQAIAEQERAGQTQLVNSDRLPAQIEDHTGSDGQTAFEALGFTFGKPDARDPLFRPATLPEGWKREASDHDMWSYLVDQLGRRRVAIFYKAAFYDRRAFMSLNTLFGYVTECVRQGKDIVTDDEWATRTAVAAELRRAVEREQESVNSWMAIGERGGMDDSIRKYVAEHCAYRDKFAALAARFEAVTEA
ncbi:hypothetical protein [Streptomyces blattellae]|uniref:hypothetical protein n=1 Tax=Streptomyces blattellae TaxID=2569855 RepID=UPI0012B889AF|nr:hypothetical protein [Streptomyces blattellae]